MTRTLLASAIVLTFLSGMTPRISLAQRDGEVPRENLRAAGKVDGIPAPGIIVFKTEKGDVWAAKIESRPVDLTFTGTAVRGFLKERMFVVFTGMVTKRGMVTEPVTALTVFTPSDARPVGVVPDDLPGGGAPALFGETKPAEGKPEKGKKPARGKVEAVSCQIAGAITKISRTGELTINTGDATVKANVAENCKISVEVSDLSFVQPGDSIEMEGWYVKNQPGQAVANGKVEIVAAKPLTDTSKKKPRPVKPGETSKEDKNATGEKKGDEKPAGDEKKKTDAKGDEKPKDEAKKDE